MTCPKCGEELTREDDAQHVPHSKTRLGSVLYCEACGYEERHIQGCEPEIVCEGMVEEI